MSSSTVSLSPQFLNRGFYTRRAWETVAFYYQEWIVAIGAFTPKGLRVHGELIPWPSPLHKRVWKQLQWGVDHAHLTRITGKKPVAQLLTQILPWRRLAFNFLGAIDYCPFDDWPDPAKSDLALVQWKPRFIRTQKDGRYGWAHPAVSALFIPDADLLTPILQRISWDTPASLGTWLHDAIRQWIQHDAPDAWFDQVDATHLTPARLVGMQFSVWTSMGLGYFDTTSPLSDWLSLWPPDSEWVQVLQNEFLGE